MSADDSALRECDESGGTRYSERHSAQKGLLMVGTTANLEKTTEAVPIRSRCMGFVKFSGPTCRRAGSRFRAGPGTPVTPPGESGDIRQAPILGLPGQPWSCQPQCLLHGWARR